jgi:hypothetical protein
MILSHLEMAVSTRYLVLPMILTLGFGWLAGGEADRGKAAVRLFFTGDVRGSFDPCGCPAGPTGGLARRVGYARALARTESGTQLHIDAGNYLEMPGPQAAAINRLMIDSLSRLPISVLNLGIEDLFWWSDLATVDLPHTRIISTNLVPRRETLPAPAPYAVIEVETGGAARDGKLRIGFLGLVDPAWVKPNSGFRALDPLEAVARVKEEVAGQSDILIVLWDTIRPQGEIPGDSPIRRMAEQNDEIRFIITTEQRFFLYDPILINRATLLSSVERGRYLGELLLEIGPDGGLATAEARFEEMKEGVPEDPVLRAEQARLSTQLH